jgi:MFS family permease
VGTFVLPPTAQLLVATVGWRSAYVIFAAAVLVILTSVAVIMRRDPDSMGLHPDGDAAAPPRATDDPGEWPLSRAIRTPTFWLLGATFTATWVPVFIPLVHLVPFTRDLGYSPLVGAWSVSTLGAAAVAGRLVMGPLSDRIGRRPTLAVAMVLQAIAFGGFAGAQAVQALFLSAAAFGYSYGTISTLFPAIVGDFFGRAAAGALVGFLFMLAGSMAAWGPLGAGAIYDTTGSYTAAFMLAAVLNGVALALLAATRPPALRLAHA